jgi:hypothetical protein
MLIARYESEVSERALERARLTREAAALRPRGTPLLGRILQAIRSPQRDAPLPPAPEMRPAPSGETSRSPLSGTISVPEAVPRPSRKAA